MDQPSPLRIAMICDPIGANHAGVLVSATRFAEQLRDRGHHVVFIGARSKQNPDHDYHHDMRVYRFRSIPIPKSGGWSLAFPTVREVKQILTDERINVVHIILPMSGAIVAVKAARDLGVKIVAHSHSQPENLFMDMPKVIQPTLGNLWNKYLAWVYSKAESIIYPSKMAHSLLSHLTDPGKHSVVISNGINAAEFRTVDVGDFYERYAIPRDTINLVFVGRLFPEKSIDTLIKAVPYITKRHPKVHVMIVGGGHLRRKLEVLAEDLGVAHQVTFLGLVSEEDKLFAYNASDIFVLPSFAELEGMVVLEAMACGKPIIISDSKMSASRYFVEDNGFLFETANPEHLADRALRLILDAELRKEMGEASREKSKQYDIHRSVDSLENVYREVTQNK